jgi:hypothetical protein
MVQRPNPLTWLWFLPAIALLIAGLAVGFTSHQITQRVLVPVSPPPDPYEASSQNGTFNWSIGETTGNVYIQPNGSTDYFVALTGDFSPAITQSDMDNSAGLSYIARTDTTTLDPGFAPSSGVTVTQAHKIVKLVLYDKNSNVQETFTDQEYTSYLAAKNQRIYTTTTSFVNEWPLGIALILAGVIWSAVIALALFLKQRDRQRQLALMGMYPSPYQGTFPPMYTPQYPYTASSPYNQVNGEANTPSPPPPPLYP